MRDLRRAPVEPARSGQPILTDVEEGDRRSVPDVCRTLHDARLRAGYELRDAAQTLRIQESHLAALEEGRFDALPGATYAVGFVRSYAGLLKLDIQETVDAFKREMDHEAGGADLSFPTPGKEGRRPRAWLVLLALILAGLAYGGWQYYESDGRVATDLVADVSDRFSETVGRGEETASGETATPAATVSPAATVAPEAVAPVAPAATVAPEAVVAVAPEETVVAEVPEAISAPEATVPPEDEAAVAPEELVAPEAESTVASASPPATREAAVETAAPEPAEALSTVDMAARDESGAAAAAVAAPADGAEAALAAGAPDAAVGGNEAATPPAASEIEAPEVAAFTQDLAIEAALDYETLPESGVPASPSSTESAAAPEAQPQAAAPADAGAAPPAAVEAEAHVPQVYGRSNVSARVVIAAYADSWVQVQGPDDELLLTRILRPGDIYRVPDRPGLVMVTGNAGALEVRVDGKVLPPLGPVGVVLRNIPLDPNLLTARLLAES